MTTNQVVALGVFDRSGRMLLGRRVQWSGLWANPGGGLERGEDWRQAAIRELRQETGLRATSMTYLGCGVSGKRGELLVHAVRVEVNGVPDSSGDPDGEFGDSLVWVDVSRGLPREIVDRLHVPVAKNVLLQKLGISGQ